MQRMALEGALKCIYWLAKNEIAHTTNYSSLMELMKGMGCSYLQHLDQGGNANYTSERVLQEFLDAISEVVKQEIFDDIRRSPCFSILMDETTDIAILKQLITYCRYVKITGNHCEVKTSFIDIDDLPDGKAETIVQSTERMFGANDLNFNQCATLGSDGAAVMVGKRSGVGQRLREKNEKLLNIHCVAHRLALAAAQAMRDIPYMKRFSNTLQQLYKYYQNSSVRMAGLTEIQVGFI
ncbi:zinc finger protein 862-like [Saccoglossus kowalevskii]